MEKEEKNTIRTGVRALWRHMRPFKRQLVILSLLGVVSAVANGFVPYVTGRFFDALIMLSRGETGSGIPVWLSFFAAWALIQLVASNVDWVVDRLRRGIDTKFHLNVQASGFAHLLRLPLSFHKREKINAVIERFSKAGWRGAAIVRTVIEIVPQFLSIIIGIALAMSINVILAGILCLGVALYVLLLFRILAPAAAFDEAAHRAWNESWGDAAEAAHHAESVKQSTAEDYETKKLEDSLIKKTYTLWYRLEKMWSNIGFFQRLIVFGTQFTVFAVSVNFVSQGIITVGELVALNGYALMFLGPFVSLGYSWQTLQNGLTAAAQAEEIYREPEEVYSRPGARGSSLSGAVRFDRVTFRYGEGQPDVLEDVSFTVTEGQVVAFVGESGVGKSTAIALVSGYYFPNEGGVYVNGMDTRAADLVSLRRQIGVVPQEVALFNATVEENIRYGTFDAADDDVRRAAREAHIDAFIETLPDKYKTLVGERGVKLSVGQKQRVAIARAILRNPRILILDEPTSALDAKTEQSIAGSLERLMKGRTTFIIAHRLSTVRKADVIFVFEKGRIVESGKHDELVRIENGAYRRLYEYQIGLH